LSVSTDVFVICGSVSMEDRVRQIDLYKKSKKNAVFIIQIKAGGQGINLQEASRVYITTPSWNPATELQAIARSHRTGQTKSVIVKRYSYVSRGEQFPPSIEQSIMSLQDHKSQVCSDVLNDPNWAKKIPNKPRHTLNLRTLIKIFSA